MYLKGVFIRKSKMGEFSLEKLGFRSEKEGVDILLMKNHYSGVKQVGHFALQYYCSYVNAELSKEALS